MFNLCCVCSTGTNKHPSATFDALLATAAEEHNKSLQEEQKQQQQQQSSAAADDRLFKSFDVRTAHTDEGKNGVSLFASSRRMRLESISPPASPDSRSQSKSGSRNRSRSSSSSSSSRSRSRSSSRSSRSSSSSSDSDRESKKKNQLKNKTLPTQPMLPVKAVASQHLHPVHSNMPKYTMHLNNVNSVASVQNAVVYNSHTKGQKTAILVGQKASSVITHKSSSGAACVDPKASSTVTQPLIKIVTKALASPTSSVSTAFPKGVTLLNSGGLSGGGVKFITGIPAGPINSQAGGQPSVMLLPQTSNGVAQGYQLVTLTSASPSASVSSNQQKPIPPTMSLSQFNVSQNEESSSQKKCLIRQSSASNVPKYSAVISSNPSVIIGNVPVTSTVSNSATLKQSSNVANQNSTTGLQLSMYNHSAKPQIVPVATFQAQNPSQSSGQQQKSKQSLSSPPPKSGHSPTSLQSGPQAQTPVPRIYTPSQGSSTPNHLAELPHNRCTPVPGSSLLIPSNITQLQNQGTFNPPSQFNPQSFPGNHSGLATLVGIRPNQRGESHHTIRLQGYQGLATQQLAMYSDQAIKPNFSTFHTGGKTRFICLCYQYRPHLHTRDYFSTICLSITWFFYVCLLQQGT